MDEIITHNGFCVRLVGSIDDTHRASAALNAHDDMLAALKEFKDFLESAEGHKHALATSNHPSGIAYRKVCAAISKAEGR